jgi:hypothetical protein
MATSFCHDVDRRSLIQQPGFVRHPEIVQTEVEAEDLPGTLRELLRDGIQVPRFIGLAIRGREDQPVVWNADKAQVDVGAIRRASDDPLISLTHPEQQGNQGVVYGDRAPAALTARWQRESEVSATTRAPNLAPSS